MKKVGIIIVIILAFVLTAPVSAAVGVQTEPTEVKDNFCLEIENEIDTRRTQVGYFTENLGQWDTELDFVATTSFGYIGLGRQNAFYYLVDSEDDDLNVLKYTFETSTEITPKGLDPLSHRSNYFYGNNPDLWVTDVKSYSTILYENLWDNIDLRYSMGQQGLKYELVARPGSELTDIKIKVEGHEQLGVQDSNLIINIPDGESLVDRDLKVFYQDNTEEPIEASFEVIENNYYTFNLQDYDPTREVVIDPFIYATYLGGDNGDSGNAIEHDSVGNAYVTGIARSVNFPTTSGAHDEDYNTDWDVFVTKYDTTGSNLVYSTFVGGDLAEVGYGIDVDASFNAYVTGYTASTDFPWTPGSNDTSHNGNNDAFIFKLNPSGSGMTYSTFLGGSGSDVGRSIYVDVNLNAFITGDTTSSDWPTTPGTMDDTIEGSQDVIVVKLDPTGASLLFSSYFGGDGIDKGNDLALGPGREPYITGETSSSNLPTNIFSFSQNFNGGSSDAFAIRINISIGFLTYCTYLGGVDTDVGKAIKLNGSSYAIIVGDTKSANFPTTPGCYNSTYKGGGVYEDVFVMSLDPGGSNLNFSTFVSGSHNDRAYGVDLDKDKNVYVTGYSHSTDFPTTPDAYNDTLYGSRDVILFKLDPAGEELLYSTFIGGGSLETGNDLVMDNNNTAYVTGWTWSTDFPVTPGANDTSYNTNEDAFVFKFQFGDSLSPPRGLKTNLGYGYVDLTWLEPAVTGGSPITGYNVYRGLTSGGESLLTSVGNVLSYNDTTTTPGTVYYYYVTALNATAESGPSNEVVAIDLIKPNFIIDNTPLTPTTGDEFTFSVKVIDNFMLTSVNVDYWIGTDSHNNVSMTNVTKTDWEYTISIPHSLETLHYIFYADDLYSNFNFTIQNNLTIVDNDLTLFGTDSTPTELTTGKEYIFEIEVTDNIDVDQVWVEYWFDPNENTNASMVKDISDTWWYPLKVLSTETYPLHYIFHSNDTSDNWNATTEIVVNVTDKNLVVFVTDKTPTTATTGDSFTFAVEVTDNIQVDDVWVEYWYGSSGPSVNLSMTKGTGDDWQLSITADHTLDNLNYIFHAQDISGTWNETFQKAVTVIDNDLPDINDYTPATSTYTGAKFPIVVNVTDNIDINSVVLEYWFGDHGTKYPVSLSYSAGYYTSEIDIPINSLDALHFNITPSDTSDNTNPSAIFDVTVLDGIEPSLEMVEEQTIGKGEMFNLTVSASDNIGITEVIWTDSPISSTNLKLEGTVDEEGEYSITVTVKDAAGNSNATTFTLIVEDTVLDSDEDGMPDSWENLHGLDPDDPSDADDDPDDDGVSNLDEYKAGTDPNNPDSVTPPDDTTPSKEKTDDENYFWIMILIVIIAIVVVIVVVVLFMNKRKVPEEPFVPPEGERLEEIAPPDQLAVPVSYPEQELVQPGYEQVQEPLLPETGEVQPPEQLEMPPTEQPPQLGQPPQEVGQIPAPMPAEQLPGSGDPQPQLPPSEPEPEPAVAEPETGTLPLEQPVEPETATPEPEPTDKPVQPESEETEGE